MKKAPFLLLTLLSLSTAVVAQNRVADSAQVAQALIELLRICKQVDSVDSKTSELGIFYKAAPYIVYRGEDTVRKWKDAADYTKAEDKKGVDEVCFRINQAVKQDEHYRFTGYRSETESEGTWHVITVAYRKKGVERKADFAFLLIKGRYRLGDID